MERWIELSKILSEQTRFRILLLLRPGPLCVCELSGIMNLSQPKVSKSLGKLKDVGLIVDQRKERFVYYQLRQDNERLLQLLEHISKDLQDDETYQTDMQRREDKDQFLQNCRIK